LSESKDTTLYCSFCGKSQHEVKKLVAGPQVYICDECAVPVFDIVQETDRMEGEYGSSALSLTDLSEGLKRHPYSAEELLSVALAEAGTKPDLSALKIMSFMHRTLLNHVLPHVQDDRLYDLYDTELSALKRLEREVAPLTTRVEEMRGRVGQYAQMLRERGKLSE